MGDPEKTDPVALAVEEAADTGKAVVIDELTTESTIMIAQPDGMVEVEATAGPKRVEQADGSWADVDTTLEFTADGVRPRMVPGETLFSGGGDDLLVFLGDGEDTSVTMSWPGGALPKPVLAGDTATYADVLPDVDLVLTANLRGFSQLLVVNSPPDAATTEALSSLDIPMVTAGVALAEGEGGQLQVLAEDSGELLGVAAAPLMWDARTDLRTDQPVALREMGVAVQDQAGAPVTAPEVADKLDAATGSLAGEAAGGAASVPDAAVGEVTLVLSPDMSLFTALDTVFPVTIDPTQTLGAIGDTFVQSSIANTPQGGATELRAGTYDGGATIARSYLRFDVAALKNRDVQSATLAMWNFHSFSCSPRWTDVRDALPFNPDTMTWNSQPIVGAIVANAYGAMGFSSACPAGWMNFDMTNWARQYADTRNNRPNTMHLAVVSASERDNATWKKFSSGNGLAGPGLYFTFDGNCSLYNGYRVCGAIRDKYLAQGGPNGVLGLPTTSETSILYGAFNHFQGGSIYSSFAGTYLVTGAIKARWGAIGWELSPLGYPVGDAFCYLSGGGCGQHYERGSIYWSPTTGAWDVAGKMRDKWAATGWENGPLRYPTSGQNPLPGSNAWQSFSGDSNGQATMYLTTGAPAAYYVQGAIRAKYAGMDSERSYLGFPTSDNTPVSGDGLLSTFEGGSLVWSRASGAWDLSGSFEDAWLEMGGPDGQAGYPTSSQGTQDYGARQDFLGGQLLQETADPGPRFCTITGTSASDTLTGTPGDDTICGVGGDDTIEAGAGDDTVYGDAGSDSLTGGAGSDSLMGGAGNDRLVGQDGDDNLSGDDGEDEILGGSGLNVISGGAESDILTGGPDVDIIYGDAGHDRVNAGAGDDSIEGGPGDDSLAGESGSDEMTGGDGDDVLKGGLDSDHIAGGSGDDTILGGDGNDELLGGLGQDALAAEAGDDRLYGGPLGDTLDGGTGLNWCRAAAAGTDMAACDNSVTNTPQETTASYVTESVPDQAPVSSPLASGSVFTFDSDLTTATAAVSAAQGVTMQPSAETSNVASSPTAQISLPGAQTLKNGQLTSDGTIVYEDLTGRADVAVQFIDDTARIATIIDGPTASPNFSYTLTTPTPVRPVMHPDGAITFMDANDVAVTAVDAPWARDAAGNHVPTSYSWSDGVLTQQVDVSGVSAWPVVADPAWGYTFDTKAYSPYAPTYEVGYKSTAARVWTELLRCFNCSFPIGNAPRTFPAVGQTIPLNASPFSFINVPAPVRMSYASRSETTFRFMALKGHFDGAGSLITFRFYNDSKGLLHLQVRARVMKDRGSAANLANRTVAQGKWTRFVADVACNTDKYQYGARHPAC